MKILAIEHNPPGVSEDQFTVELLQAEARRAWELQQAGTIRELYFRADRDEAVLMLECHDLDEARSILNTLPLLREKLIEFELIPLQAYPGFARLFAADARWAEDHRVCIDHQCVHSVAGSAAGQSGAGITAEFKSGARHVRSTSRTKRQEGR
jgi:muconolactone delta-isomerase